MAKPVNAAIVDLRGRKWNPFETTGTTGFVKFTEAEGDIHVPYGTDPVSLMVQAHELSHVRYSAKIWPDLSVELPRLVALAKTTSQIVGYAEDMRITALAGRLGVKTLPEFGNTDDKPVIDGWVEAAIKAGIPEARVKKAARFILTQHTAMVARLGLSLNTLQEQANAERYITEVAGILHKLLSRGEAPPSEGKPTKSDDKSESKPSKDEGKGEPKPKPKPEPKPEPEDNEEDDSEKSEGEGEGDDSQEDEQPEEGESSEGESGDDSEEGDDSDDSDDSSADGEGDAEGDDSSSSSGDGADSDASDSDEDDSTDVSGSIPGEGGDFDGVISLHDKALPDIRQAMLNSVPAPVDTQKLIQEFQHTLDTADWVPVTSIDRVPLVRRAAQARNRGRKLTEVGVALGSAYDAVSPNERRPFVAKRKGGVGGLTVVVDCSGSMRIDPQQLETLLLKYPTGVVVTYSSSIGEARNGSQDKAIVRVIASHGRLAATANFRDDEAGGNGCDGPMLEWLAKQSGERVWVCDGAITQKRDKGVFYNYLAMEAWLKAHRITQFYSLDAYLESLT